MKPPPIVVRRTVIDPLWPALAILLAVLFLVVAAAGALAAPLASGRRLLRLALFGALYMLLDASLMIGCALLWLRHPVRAGRDEARWSGDHERMLRAVLSLLVGAARPLFGFRVVLQEPPDRDRIIGRPLLVLARHGGPGDSFALVELLMSCYQRRPAIVMKQTLRWDPALDVVLGRLPTCFVASGEGRKAAMRIAALARAMRPDDAILLFPEGCNWTPGRHIRAIARLHRAGRGQAAAEAAGNPNVLPPQPAGLLACLQARPDLDIAVVAHTGLDDLVSPGLVWRALPVSSPMIVRWWYTPASSLPDTDAGRREWLRLQWAVVDSWIDARKAARVPAPVVQTATGAAVQRDVSDLTAG